MNYNKLLTVHSIAVYCNVNPKTVREWCNTGAISASHDHEKNTWQIMLLDFVDFLYFNPKYRSVMENKRLNGNREALRCEILTIVYRRKYKLYTVDELANIFYLSHDAIRDWIDRKNLSATRRNKSTSKILVKAVDVAQFINSSEYLKKRYGCRITDRFLNWERDNIL